MADSSFAPFITLGPYLFSAGDNPICEIEASDSTVYVDYLLPPLSIFGGSLEEVGAGDVTITSYEETLRLWWLLKNITFLITAKGTYKFYPVDPPGPPEDRPWSISLETKFPGVPVPNSPSGRPVANPDYRVLNCNIDDDPTIFRQTSTIDYQGSAVDLVTHLAPFSQGFLLSEFIAYFDSLAPDAGLTSTGVFIISSRNKDYKDVIFEGDEDGARTQQIGFNGFEATLLTGKSVNLYASFFTLNVNSFDFKVDEFKIFFSGIEGH